MQTKAMITVARSGSGQEVVQFLYSMAGTRDGRGTEYPPGVGVG